MLGLLQVRTLILTLIAILKISGEISPITVKKAHLKFGTIISSRSKNIIYLWPFNVRSQSDKGILS